MTDTTTLTQRSPEWHSARTNRLTASNCGAVLGLDPFRTRDDVMRMMVRDYHGVEREFVGNVATMHGQFHEEGAKFDFEMETGLRVEECGFFTYEDWLGGSPDGLIGEKELIEIKCPYGKRKDEEPIFKSIDEQLHYYAQMQVCLLAAGRESCFFYQWAANGTKLERIGYDDDWHAINRPILAQFYAEYLSERDNPDHLLPKRVVIDTPTAHKMSAEFDQLAEAISLAEERKKELLAEMVALAGGKDATFAGRKLTKVDVKGKVSYGKAIAVLLPDADLSKWTGKPSSHWRFGS